jgi:acyl-CoA reductase-like NAD-dependent aldehyde dehydrogenase
MVGLNRAKVSDPRTPSGGVKQSDEGRKAARRACSSSRKSQHVAVIW